MATGAGAVAVAEEEAGGEQAAAEAEEQAQAEEQALPGVQGIRTKVGEGRAGGGEGELERI
jgi:hypothetical protein